MEYLRRVRMVRNRVPLAPVRGPGLGREKNTVLFMSDGFGLYTGKKQWILIFPVSTCPAGGSLSFRVLPEQEWYLWNSAIVSAMTAPRDSGLERLAAIEQIVQGGLDEARTNAVLSLIGIPPLSNGFLAVMKIYSEYLPKSEEMTFSKEQRLLHFLWDAFERTPVSLATNFAIPFRRILAKKLFRQCGKNFCAEANVRFNFGQAISAGDNLFINCGTFLDTKGGLIIGDSVGIGEFVRIFTHNHSESDHAERTYDPVTIKDYAKIYSNSLIFPGVTIGEQAIVAGGAVVTKDVPPNTLVAGIPAKVIRQRKNEGRVREELNHVWLNRGAFQDE
jgi:acetyltransferase-like isoleucine patch superfamily enzyme